MTTAKSGGLSPGTDGTFELERPWPIPLRSECDFYHSLEFPDGETVAGIWDIRGRFDQYIGKYPLAGKTVLDVGTASGFLAFSAERAGARVTAIEARHASELRHVPFADLLYHRDRKAWVDAQEESLQRRKNGFWFAWHKLNSGVEVAYAPLDTLPYWRRRFNVVIAGAIIEHLADPVSAIGAMARLADEALIIAFTDVNDSDAQFMQPMGHWLERQAAMTWWLLSRGLYRRVFENLGFSVEFLPASALYNKLPNSPEVTRLTIIARRMAGAHERTLPEVPLSVGPRRLARTARNLIKFLTGKPL